MALVSSRMLPLAASTVDPRLSGFPRQRFHQTPDDASTLPGNHEQVSAINAVLYGWRNERLTMTESFGRQATINQSAIGASPVALTPQSAIEKAYDGSEVIFRLLRLETPGSALMNLGFFLLRGPVAFLNILGDLGRAQMRLVYRSAQLLSVGSGHRVLDVACGRGQSSYVLQCLNPHAEVVGIDLSDRNIAVARTLFGQLDHLTYQSGDAMSLSFPDRSFDRVICVEAAFHFRDKTRFLQEAFRVLRPGGKLVVVDFAWNSDAERSHLNDPGVRLVRRIWSWDDFFSVLEYQQVADSAGFRDGGHQDWTKRVTVPIGTQLNCVSALGATSLGRRFLRWKNPLFSSFTARDFEACRLAAQAHTEVQKRSRYMAFVFHKPATNARPDRN